MDLLRGGGCGSGSSKGRSVDVEDGSCKGNHKFYSASSTSQPGNRASCKIPGILCTRSSKR